MSTGFLVEILHHNT